MPGEKILPADRRRDQPLNMTQPFARNIKLFGYHDLNSKPAFKLRGYFLSGLRDSGKYLDGDQTLTVTLWQPRTRSSRMIRI